MILVGDAVFRFLADTTQVDAAFERIRSDAPAKLQPATAAMLGLGESIAQTGGQAAGTAEDMALLGIQTQRSGTDTKASTADWQLLFRTLGLTGPAATAAGAALQGAGTKATEAGTKVGGAGQKAKETAFNWQFAGSTATVAGGKFTQAGGLAEEAGVRTSRSMREAKAEIALVGEEIGVKVPRHLRGFLAELPGVGVALNAAFSATAVLILIQILVEGIAKLAEWIKTTFIFTQAMHQAQQEIAQTTATLKEHEKELDAVRQRYEEIGKTGSVKTRIEFEFAVKDEAIATERLNHLDDAVTKLRQGSFDLKDVKNNINALIKSLPENKDLFIGDEDEVKKRLEKVLIGDDADQASVLARAQAFHDRFFQEQFEAQLKTATIGKEFDQEQLDERIKTLGAQVQAERDAADAEADIRLAGRLKENKELAVSYEEDAAAQKAAETEKFQNLVISLQQEKNLAEQRHAFQRQQLQTDLTLFEQNKNPEGVQQQNDAILNLDNQFAAERIRIDASIKAAFDQHRLDELNAEADFESKRRELIERQAQEFKAAVEGTSTSAPTTLIKIPDTINIQLDKLVEKLNTALQAYQVLRIDGSAAYTAQVQDESFSLEQLQKLYDQGLVSALDLALGKQALTEAEIQNNIVQLQNIDLLIEQGRLRGDDVSSLEEEKKRLQEETNALDDQARALDKVGQAYKGTNRLQDLYIRDITIGANKLKFFKDVAADTFAKFKQAWGSAIAAFILGQKSLGAALAQATADVLANLAGQAAVEALVELAKGFARLAVGDGAGAALHFHAAEIFGIVAAVAGGAAAGFNAAGGGNDSGSGSGSDGRPKDTIDQSQPVNQPERQPVTVVNVPKFATGALVSTPTLAVIGDTKGSGRGSREMALPLDDPEAVAAIVEALGGGGGDRVYVNVEGMISDDILDKVIQKINRRLKSGRSVLISTGTLKRS